MRSTYRLLIAGFLTLALQATATNADAATRKSVMIPMNDGTKLATDVFLPDGGGPWSTLLYRTPYNRKGSRKGQRKVANNYGVAVVVQDTRGRFESEGTDCVFRCDTRDGAATIAWIRKQSWSNGKIVSRGGSALGIAQYMHAVANPKGLEAMWVQVGTPKLYDHAMFWDGVFRKSMIENWLSGQMSTFFLKKIKAHPTEDSFWDSVQTEDDYGKVNVPAVHWGGWYDIFSQGTIDAFKGYQHQGGAGARGKQKLVMGPWVHGAWNKQQKQGELMYPKNAFQGGPFKRKLPTRWLAHYLGLQDHSQWIKNYPAVHYYVMGDVSDPSAPGNTWRTASDWPPDAAPVRMYLQPNGGLEERCPPSGGGKTSYSYDPADPVPTKGGNNLTIQSGPLDQRSIESRNDVVVWETPKLQNPMEITGRVKARLFVSTDTKDTDLVVRMTDVYPDGRSMLVLDAPVRLAARNGDKSLDFVQPGRVVEAVVDLWSTSIILDQGHRLRISISSSNSPRFWPNPNDGSTYGEKTSPTKAHVSIHTSKQYPSYLLAPDPSRAGQMITRCDSAAAESDPMDRDTSVSTDTSPAPGDVGPDATAPVSDAGDRDSQAPTTGSDIDIADIQVIDDPPSDTSGCACNSLPGRNLPPAFLLVASLGFLALNRRQTR